MTPPDVPRGLFRRVVPALGIAQIISWGTLFYAIAVLGAPMRDELKTSDVILFGSFTCGLFVSGIVSPWVGRRIDAHGGRGVLAGGSLIGAFACGTLALAQSPITLFIGWVLAGIATAATLYDPAFATLHRISGAQYRRAVTALTLFGGFASTVFWPLSQFLLDTIGWRETFGLYAALHAFVCFPLHVVCVPNGTPAAAASPPVAPPMASATQRNAAFMWLATALARATFVSSALAAHLIGLLTTSGLPARDAVLVGSLIGPMQVAGRVMEFAFTRHIRALFVGSRNRNSSRRPSRRSRSHSYS